jgi:hypothetical protein
MHFFHPIALWGGVAVMLVGVYLVTQLDETAAQVAAGGATVMMLTVGAISEGRNRPIWRMIEKWTHETVPDHWQQLRRTWSLAHTLRTAAAFLAVVLFAVAAIIEFG